MEDSTYAPWAADSSRNVSACNVLRTMSCKLPDLERPSAGAWTSPTLATQRSSLKYSHEFPSNLKHFISRMKPLIHNDRKRAGKRVISLLKVPSELSHSKSEEWRGKIIFLWDGHASGELREGGAFYETWVTRQNIFFVSLVPQSITRLCTTE